MVLSSLVVKVDRIAASLTVSRKCLSDEPVKEKVEAELNLTEPFLKGLRVIWCKNNETWATPLNVQGWAKEWSLGW